MVSQLLPLPATFTVEAIALIALLYMHMKITDYYVLLMI